METTNPSEGRLSPEVGSVLRSVYERKGKLNGTISKLSNPVVPEISPLATPVSSPSYEAKQQSYGPEPNLPSAVNDAIKASIGHSNRKDGAQRAAKNRAQNEKDREEEQRFAADSRRQEAERRAAVEANRPSVEALTMARDEVGKWDNYLNNLDATEQRFRELGSELSELDEARKNQPNEDVIARSGGLKLTNFKENADRRFVAKQREINRWIRENVPSAMWGEYGYNTDADSPIQKAISLAIESGTQEARHELYFNTTSTGESNNVVDDINKWKEAAVAIRSKILGKMKANEDFSSAPQSIQNELNAAHNEIDQQRARGDANENRANELHNEINAAHNEIDQQRARADAAEAERNKAQKDTADAVAILKKLSSKESLTDDDYNRAKELGVDIPMPNDNSESLPPTPENKGFGDRAREMSVRFGNWFKSIDRDIFVPGFLGVATSEISSALIIGLARLGPESIPMTRALAGLGLGLGAGVLGVGEAVRLRSARNETERAMRYKHTNWALSFAVGAAVDGLSHGLIDALTSSGVKVVSSVETVAQSVRGTASLMGDAGKEALNYFQSSATNGPKTVPESIQAAMQQLNNPDLSRVNELRDNVKDVYASIKEGGNISSFLREAGWNIKDIYEHGIYDFLSRNIDTISDQWVSIGHGDRVAGLKELLSHTNHGVKDFAKALQYSKLILSGTYAIPVHP